MGPMRRMGLMMIGLLAGLALWSSGCMNADKWSPGETKEDKSTINLPGLGQTVFTGERDTVVTADLEGNDGVNIPNGLITFERLASTPLAERGRQQTAIEGQRFENMQRTLDRLDRRIDRWEDIFTSRYAPPPLDPAMGAQSISGDGGDGTVGWHSAEYVDLYGTADQFGADLDTPRVTLRTYLNKCGYTRLRFVGTTSCTLTFVTTMEGLDSGYLTRPSTSRQGGASATERLTPSGTSLTLPAAARRVSSVFAESDLAAAIAGGWIFQPTNLFDQSVAAADAWFDQPPDTAVTLNAAPGEDVTYNAFPRAEYSVGLANAQPEPPAIVAAAVVRVRAGRVGRGRRP